MVMAATGEWRWKKKIDIFAAQRTEEGGQRRGGVTVEQRGSRGAGGGGGGEGNGDAGDVEGEGGGGLDSTDDIRMHGMRGVHRWASDGRASTVAGVDQHGNSMHSIRCVLLRAANFSIINSRVVDNISKYLYIDILCIKTMQIYRYFSWFAPSLHPTYC